MSNHKVSVSESIRDTTVERKPFEAAIRKLLKAPPTPKDEISAKITKLGRRGPITRRILET